MGQRSHLGHEGQPPAPDLADYQDRYLVTVRDIETGKDQILTASWSHPFFARMPENTPMPVGAEGLVYQGAIEWAAWVDAKDL
ncbi:hypothetical protein RNZ50_01070 [Paracoccaceae bacterium Fryx2]|nr:hypothetical protein [Paracoccaceae bacterium Fryx2]